jgi:hypothetical protein
MTQIGLGQARVEGVASNRRYAMPDGAIRWDRTSATKNAYAIAADEGLIDPWLRALSFWDGGDPIAAVSFYAVHPMSYYGQGDISADFPGLARRMRQEEMPDVFQVYVSGASGNVTAGKHNTGARENRPVLAGRLKQAMVEAWRSTRRMPAHSCELRVAKLDLEPRASDGFRLEELERALTNEAKPFEQCLAAMGGAAIVLLPGESYIEYQLHAQSLRPNDFICVAGYGDGATGYVPTEAHWREGDTNLRDWCWVAPGSEPRMKAAIAQALGV